jgi:hypothetical protein
LKELADFHGAKDTPYGALGRAFLRCPSLRAYLLGPLRRKTVTRLR